MCYFLCQIACPLLCISCDIQYFSLSLSQLGAKKLLELTYFLVLEARCVRLNFPKSSYGEVSIVLFYMYVVWVWFNN